MQILDDVRFFGWLQQRGIVADAERGTGDRLAFAEGGAHERRWRPGGIVSDLPDFSWAVLNAALQGGPWWVWRRGGGPWMDEFGEEGGLRNASLDRLLGALGYGGGSGALKGASGPVADRERVLRVRVERGGGPVRGAGRLLLHPPVFQ